MTERKYYAHTHPDYPDTPDRWQPLEAHLKAVAELAAEFAKPFCGAEWAYIAGLWHDLGETSSSGFVRSNERTYDLLCA